MSSPARVTTNDGTPAFVIKIAWRNPITVVITSAMPIAAHHGQSDASGRSSRVIITPPTALTYATDRSISPISSTKTMPMAMVAIAAICRSRLVKFRSMKNVVVEQAEHDGDDDEADDDRQRAELAGA